MQKFIFGAVVAQGYTAAWVHKVGWPGRRKYHLGHSTFWKWDGSSSPSEIRSDAYCEDQGTMQNVPASTVCHRTQSTHFKQQRHTSNSNTQHEKNKYLNYIIFHTSNNHLSLTGHSCEMCVYLLITVENIYCNLLWNSYTVGDTNSLFDMQQPL